MKLIATPRSHFSRKVRLLLDHLDLPYELLDVGNVAENNPAAFHGNPVMSVPVLEDGSVWVLDSDHIAVYLVKRYDPADRFGVLTFSVESWNARAVMNSIMANEVKIILAERTGLDPKAHAYFQKASAAIEQGLEWLNARPTLFRFDQPGYNEFHFISVWDHLELYKVVELHYPNLRKLATILSGSERIERSKPK